MTVIMNTHSPRTQNEIFTCSIVAHSCLVVAVRGLFLFEQGHMIAVQTRALF